LGERSEESAIEKWNTRTAPVVIHADPEPEQPPWSKEDKLVDSILKNHKP
jgi:hypothetical protein